MEKLLNVMNQKTVVQLLSGGDRHTLQRISDLITAEQQFTEILEEYIIATKTLEKWIQADGIDSLRVNQYRDLVREREQEMREILQCKGILSHHEG